MSSRSESKADQTSVTTDNRVQADGNSKVISSGGGDLHIVADEAFELGFVALETTATLADGVTKTLANALKSTQLNSRTESAQMGEQIIKLGIPAVALAYVLSKGFK
jgi:hypothetical protein